ncbi:MAG: DUF2786 domain-containing protein [Dongiaceae bacterium]
MVCGWGSPGRSRAEEHIATGFNDAERKRFQGLLRLAAESPYVGERENALAAAHRLASRHDMTIEEAAGMERPRTVQRRPDSSSPRNWFADQEPIEVGRFMHLTEYALRLAKSRHEAALREARSRGLDAGLAARRRRDQRIRPNSRRMEPRDHARVLLTETRLRLKDIVDITGLDIYQVVGMKLLLRRAA